MKVTGQMTLKQCHFRITLCYAPFMQFETTDFYGSISNSRKILYQCLYSYIMEKYRFTTYHEKFYKQVTTTTTMTPVQWLLFQNNLGKPVPERKNQSGFKWGKRWWGSGMQWHQLDHMQTICTSLQTDNHTNTLSLNFYRPDALPDAQPTV